MPVVVGGTQYIVEELRCRFLAKEPDGHYLCTVYENRFEKAPWCHTAVEAAANGMLAHDCPYAEDIPNYKGRQWATARERDKLLPIIRQKLVADGLPISCNPDAAMQVLTCSGERWSWSEQKDRFVFYREACTPDFCTPDLRA